MKKLMAILVACLMPICLIAGSGDVNGDGKVNVADIVELLNHLKGYPTKSYNASEADANNDGKVDFMDVSSIADIVVNHSLKDQQSYRYFCNESTGDEIIISSAGDVLLQKNNEDGGCYIEMCSYDEVKEDFTTENCVVVEMDEQEQIRSIIFSDFSIILTPYDNGQISLTIIKNNGEYKLLGIIHSPAKTRTINSPSRKSIIDRLSTINDFWGIIEEPLMAEMEIRNISLKKLAGSITSFSFGKYEELKMERVGNDFSTTIGGGVSLVVEGLFNIAMRGAAFSNPWSAGLFLLNAYIESKNHLFNELIGKNFFVNFYSPKRLSWNQYEAYYFVSGIKQDARYTPEIDFVYYPNDNNAGWATFPETVRHACENDIIYVRDMKNLSPGPNQFWVDVYIEGLRFLGSFMRKKYDFFVGLNQLASVEVQQYEEGNSFIKQPLLVYSVNHNELYPLADFGVYIRHNETKHYSHTQSLLQNSISNEGYSIGAVNQVTQLLTIEIDKKDLVFDGITKRKPASDYFIGAYTYNFKTGEYEYYDERPLDLEYVQSMRLCPDDNHPHMIDLGLPCGTKWACCNVDAKKPEEYGAYFAWGETKEKNSYLYSTYSYYLRDDKEWWCSFIGNDIGGTAFDVANARWGGGWKIPSKEQWEELINNTTVISYNNLNGVDGMFFIGSNGESIFLPYAGEKYGELLYYKGECGYYWSSTYYEWDGLWFFAGEDAWKTDFFNDVFGLERCERITGLPVRPVFQDR